MSLQATPEFKTAEAADANFPAAKVELVLGNYFSADAYGSTASASSTYSADYPASGAIDGDRTDLNIGAASGADNDIGLSMWASSGTPCDLTITMTEARTLNRIKIYHLTTNHSFTSYKLEYWDGGSWVAFAATADLIAGDEVELTPNESVETIDFPDISTTKIKLTINSVHAGDTLAYVVEIEAYRVVDITDRVKRLTINRQRDYKMQNPMAATLNLELNNDDRFFSLNHTPTVEEISDGFVNSELKPNIGVIVTQGFNLFGNNAELVPGFVGYVDSFKVSPASRTAFIEARDGMKILINKIDSTKLKTSIDIADAIIYILNRANISTYETDITTTNITISYFFTKNEAALTSIQNLAQAAVDALFWFDENGIATFRFYVDGVSQNYVYTSQVDWQAGSLTSIDTTRILGNIFVGFNSSNAATSTNWAASLTGWTYTNGAGNTWQMSASGIYFVVTNTVTTSAYIYRGQTKVSGRWSWSMYKGVHAGTFDYYFFMATGLPTDFNHTFSGGYAMKIQWGLGSTTVSLVKQIFGTLSSDTILTSTIYNSWTTSTEIIVSRSPTGYMVLSINGSDILTATDSTYSTSTYMGVFSQETFANAGFTKKLESISVPSDTLTATWVSNPINLGMSALSLDLLTSTQVLNGGTIDYYTASSPDSGSTWDSYTAIGASGTILSTLYTNTTIKTRVDLNTVALTGDPYITDITVAWTSAGGATKYPPSTSFSFAYNSTMLDVMQEYTDNLGGDSSIINSVEVNASPLVLEGTNTTVLWEGTTGVPAVAISASNPYAVTPGDYYFYPEIDGMDVSRMTGTDAAALVIGWTNSASGHWLFSTIHPTKPVVKITVAAAGNIATLQLQGKIYSSANYIQVQKADDTDSIASYGERKFTISNPWIVSATIADQIATTYIGNFKDPTSYISSITLRPTYSAQIGDRVTVEDNNLDLNADYIITGIQHNLACSTTEGQADTKMTLLKVPTGL